MSKQQNPVPPGAPPPQVSPPSRYTILLTSAASLALGVVIASVTMLYGPQHTSTARIGRLPGACMHPSALVQVI
jgi:hypothetical protein